MNALLAMKVNSNNIVTYEESLQGVMQRRRKVKNALRDCGSTHILQLAIAERPYGRIPSHTMLPARKN